MIYLILRLFVLLVIAMMLGYGWFGPNPKIALYGAIGFIGFVIVELIALALVLKKNFDVSNVPSHSFLKKSSEWLGGAIVFGSLIATFPESTRETGLIIWFGTVGSYIVMPLILEFVGGIPIKWTYFGGWKILGRPRRRK